MQISQETHVSAHHNEPSSSPRPSFVPSIMVAAPPLEIHISPVPQASIQKKQSQTRHHPTITAHRTVHSVPSPCSQQQHQTVNITIDQASTAPDQPLKPNQAPIFQETQLSLSLPLQAQTRRRHTLSLTTPPRRRTILITASCHHSASALSLVSVQEKKKEKMK